MADTKISALSALTAANSATDDVLVLVDTSATQTKKMSISEAQVLFGSTGLDLATEVAANATAVIGEDLPVNSTAAARTITAPTTTTAGDEFGVFDSRGQSATNNITIPSFLHHGSSQPYVISINGGGVSFKWVDGTVGYKIEREVN